MKCTQYKICALLLTFVGLGLRNVAEVQAQLISAPNDTGTLINHSGNRFDISGGKLSGDQVNLFHSFLQLDLHQNQIANFRSNSSIRNILVRVLGGDASHIDGDILVTGGSPHLFLMNPAGIFFGSNARVSVPGSFTATTANGIGFGSKWLSASGVNDYEKLGGTPNTFAFTMAQPGAIVNLGSLQVGEGKQLTLLGGTILSTGGLTAPKGSIVIAAMPGNRFVRLTPTGSLLNLEIQHPVTTNLPESWTLPILSLPQLLTGGNVGHAQIVRVTSNGQVQLVGSNLSAEPGDVVVSGKPPTFPNELFLGSSNRIITNAYSPPAPIAVPSPIGFSPPPEPLASSVAPYSPASPFRIVFDARVNTSTSGIVALAAPDCFLGCPKMFSTRGLSSVNTSSPTETPIYNFEPNQSGNSLMRVVEPLPTPLESGNLKSSLFQLDTGKSLLPENQLDLLTTSAQIDQIEQYLRQRWNRIPHVTTTLRYQLLLDAQGTIQQIIPLGKGAGDYIVYLGFPGVGQPFVSPSAAAKPLQILIKLESDGRVEVLPSSLGLNN